MTGNDEKVQDSKNKSQENSVKTENTDASNIHLDEWMLKPCSMYLEEYKDCKSLRGRFYQNFYYGETLNCTSWNDDYKNCKKWENSRDETAFNELVTSEKKRRQERLKYHILNDVWKRRETPPEDWNDPLPQWMVKQNEASFLGAKQQEIVETGKDTQTDLYIPSCSIL